MRIFIEPTETLLFRKGRSFEAGDGNFAESMFPPTPETIQGALRAAIAAQSNPKATLAETFQRSKDKENELVNLIGDRDSYGRFRITGFTLGRQLTTKELEKAREAAGPDKKVAPIVRLFPLPANLVNHSNGITRLLPAAQSQGIYSNLPEGMQEQEIQYLLPPPGSSISGKPDSTGWLPEKDLTALLRGNLTPDKKSVVMSRDIYETEPRLGIGMTNSTKTIRDGMLYTALMIRMKPHYGFVVDIQLSKDAGSPEKSELETELVNDTAKLELLKSYLDNSWLTLGGERRTAFVRVLDTPDEPPELEQDRKGNLLYFATPTCFSQGWLPAHWPNHATLVSAALDHYQPIGGWKLEPGHYGGASKIMRRCVPAGSVYFFKETIDFPRPLIQNVPHTQDNYGWQIGYGINYAGEYK